MTAPKMVVISRHQAAIEFIAAELVKSMYATYALFNETSVTIVTEDCEERNEVVIPLVRGNARKEDVLNRTVYGNIPLPLSTHAECVFCVEFEGTPPRGQEYSLEDMRMAGAKLEEYRVYSKEQFDSTVKRLEVLDGDLNGRIGWKEFYLNKN